MPSKQEKEEYRCGKCGNCDPANTHHFDGDGGVVELEVKPCLNMPNKQEKTMGERFIEKFRVDTDGSVHFRSNKTYDTWNLHAVTDFIQEEIFLAKKQTYKELEEVIGEDREVITGTEELESQYEDRGYNSAKREIRSKLKELHE